MITNDTIYLVINRLTLSATNGVYITCGDSTPTIEVTQDKLKVAQAKNKGARIFTLDALNEITAYDLELKEKDNGISKDK